ncbi:MAG: hypothetical protein ACETWG_09650 [Candidatus Neomarinimicrobiota bacterium]
MIPFLGLLLLLTTSAPLAGQNSSAAPGDSPAFEDPPDSVRAISTPAALATFPLWTQPDTFNFGTGPDSLVLNLPDLKPAVDPLLRGQRLLGLGMVAVFSALAYYYHQQAEATYHTYSISGDPTELDHLYQQTARLDRMAGWCYLGAETGLILVAFSYILSP